MAVKDRINAEDACAVKLHSDFFWGVDQQLQIVNE